MDGSKISKKITEVEEKANVLQLQLDNITGKKA